MSRRDAAGNLLTPAADADHYTAALHAAEAAIDALVTTGGQDTEATLEGWRQAAKLFDEARRQSTFGAARAVHRYNQEQEAKGLKQCFQCGKFSPPEAMEQFTSGYVRKEQPDAPAGVSYRCRGTCPI